MEININEYDVFRIKEWAANVKAGSEILLTGTVYTARDAAHKRMKDMLDSDLPPPFELDGAVIYYTGPTPARDGMTIGSAGPTTSSRMDVYTAELYHRGIAATIGKGGRSEEVVEAIANTGGLYLCAVGGAGALAARSIKSLEVIAFEELGCESVKRLEVVRFPLVVGIDAAGNSIFKN